MQFRNRARRNGLAALGILLCLLAAVFAVEAKLGWYSPDSTARVEFSSTKLHAGEGPKLVADALSAPDLQTHSFIPVVALAILAFAPAIFAFRFDRSIESGKIAVSPGTFPPLFLRPPPHR